MLCGPLLDYPLSGLLLHGELQGLRPANNHFPLADCLQEALINSGCAVAKFHLQTGTVQWALAAVPI